MRIQLTGLATLALLGAGLATTPSEAAARPAPVNTISVSPAIDRSGNSTVNVSWTGADPSADGVVVCVRRGTVTPSTPSSCESRIVVDTPGTSSGAITIYPKKTYTIAVYDYIASSPDPTYSTPVSKLRHGTSLTFHEHCTGDGAGDTCRINGVLMDVYRGTTLGHRPVELWSSANMKKGAHWSRVNRVTTDGAGRAQTSITLDHSRFYQWRFVAVGKRQLPTYTVQLGIVVSS